MPFENAPPLQVMKVTIRVHTKVSKLVKILIILTFYTKHHRRLTDNGTTHATSNRTNLPSATVRDYSACQDGVQKEEK